MKISHWLAIGAAALLRRNVWINPFWEDSLTGVVDLMGADRVCFGSDYPHPEGLAEPLSFVEQLGDLGPGDVERIMSANMFELLGVPRPVAAG